MVAIVTLITGCSTGMGFSTAVHLAKASSREFKVSTTCGFEMCAFGQSKGEAESILNIQRTIFHYRLTGVRRGNTPLILKSVFPG